MPVPNVDQLVAEVVIPASQVNPKFTYANVDQLAAEIVVPLGSLQKTYCDQLVAEVVTVEPLPYKNPLGSATAIPPSTPQKYRIMVYDTNDNLVAVLTNVRSFQFNDTVNGGSAGGQFRISAPASMENPAAGTLPKQATHRRLGVDPHTTDNFTIAQVGDSITGIPTTVTVLKAGQLIVISDGRNAVQGSVLHNQTMSGNLDIVVTENINGPVGGKIDKGAIIAYASGASITNPISIQPYDYGYRVQFYLGDSTNPWYDGRVNGFTPSSPDATTDDEYITVYTEGWQTALDDGIVTETINPGPQPNGTNNGPIYAGQYLRHLITTYQDGSRFFQPYIAKVKCFLYQLQFQGDGLANCIDAVVKQVQDNTGETFEWWVRGLLTNPGDKKGRTLAVVVQPNNNPNNQSVGRIAPTKIPIQPYFVYEVKHQTCYNYSTQNTDTQVYNMIALYGGRDPVTQLQIYGAYQDSISISLFGLRQKRVENTNLLSSNSMVNYATAWLLLNGYPQPQTVYHKFQPTDAMRAGIWISLLEPGIGLEVTQNLHEMRAINVECQLQEGQELIEQIVTAAAPRPFIDHAYYGAIQASKSSVPVTISRGGSVNQNTYLTSGADWVGFKSNTKTATVLITPPLANFGVHQVYDQSSGKLLNPPVVKPVVVAMGPGPVYIAHDSNGNVVNKNCWAIELKDCNSGYTGDGAYEVVLVTDQSEFDMSSDCPSPPGAGPCQSKPGPNGTSPALLCFSVGGPAVQTGNNNNSGNVQQAPSSPNLQRLWQFVILNGAVAGATDCRTYAQNNTGPPIPGASGFVPIITIPNGTILNNFTHLHATAYKGQHDPDYRGWLDYYISDMIIWFGVFDQDGSITAYDGPIDFVDSVAARMTLYSYNFPSGYGSNLVDPVIYQIPRPVTIETQPIWSSSLKAAGGGETGSANFPGPGIFGFKTSVSVQNLLYPISSSDGGSGDPPAGEVYFYYNFQVIVTCKDNQSQIINGGDGPGVSPPLTYNLIFPFSDLPSTLNVPGVGGDYPMHLPTLKTKPGGLPKCQNQAPVPGPY